MHAKYIKYLIDIIYDSRLGCCWGSSVVGVMKTAQLLRAMNISFINYPGVFCTGWTQGGPRCRVDNDKDTRPRKSWWCDCVRVSAGVRLGVWARFLRVLFSIGEWGGSLADWKYSPGILQMGALVGEMCHRPDTQMCRFRWYIINIPYGQLSASCKAYCHLVM